MAKMTYKLLWLQILIAPLMLISETEAIGYSNWLNIREVIYPSQKDPNINISDWISIYDNGKEANVTCPQVLDPLQQEYNSCSPSNKWFALLSKWCSRPMLELQKAEKAVLSTMKINYTGRYVDVGCISKTNNDYIWTVSVNEESDNMPIVLLHGFGAGVGLWILNIPALAADRPVYAIDILGFGRSSRTPFSNDPLEAERQLMASLENWREKVHLNRMILLGHSFGGYLAAAYAYKYPERIGHLILTDSWGFPVPKNQSTETPIWMTAVRGVLKRINILGALRTAGRFGPNLLQKVRPDISRRFTVSMNNSEVILPNYIYHCNGQEPTGEKAFQLMMAGFGWAKYPMILRMESLDPFLPITFIYGEDSWVDKHSALLTQQIRNTSYVNIQVISGASHHVYADKYADYNNLVNDIGAYTDKGALPPLAPVENLGEPGINLQRFLNDD